MFLRSIIFFILFWYSDAFAVIINPTNRIDWVLGSNVGLTMDIPSRTTSLSVIDYGADNTGATDSSTAFNDAIAAASATETNVVLVPAGKYVWSNTVTLNKSGITLRGEGSNSIIACVMNAGSALILGHDAMAVDPARGFIATNGYTKGSSNMILSKIQNDFSDTVKAGDLLTIIKTTRNKGSDTFPIISVANYDGIIKQTLYVLNRSSQTITFWPPLVIDYTNSAVASAPVTLYETDTIAQPRTNIGIEHLTFTGTNYGAGTKLGENNGFIINAGCLRNCWFTNVNIQYADNYHLNLSASANILIQKCWIENALSAGTSHAGLLASSVSGLAVLDTIFSSAGSIRLFPAIEVNDGVVGSAFMGNYFTNNSTDIDIHNTHPMMNLFEQNKFLSFFELDGYFGSASHFTVYRNQVKNTMPLKRWTSYTQILGNVHGDGNTSYVWDKEESGYGSPYPIFELGYPNISNSSYNRTSPPVAWNYPGDSLSPFVAPFTDTTNGVFKFTNSTALHTNQLWTWMGTNMTGTTGFTNVLAPISVGYALMFQDGSNTNFYYGATNSDALVSTAAGTSSNLSLASYVWITNGSTLYIGGQNSYQQLQQSNKYTHNFHGILVYTNSGWSLVWDAGNADHSLSNSLLYAAAPSWWGNNRWPAIDPETSPYIWTIPAEDRYNGISNDAAPTPTRLNKGIKRLFKGVRRIFGFIYIPIYWDWEEENYNPQPQTS